MPKFPWTGFKARIDALEREVAQLREERGLRAIEWESIQLEVSRLIAQLRTARAREKAAGAQADTSLVDFKQRRF